MSACIGHILNLGSLTVLTSFLNGIETSLTNYSSNKLKQQSRFAAMLQTKII